MDSFRLVQTIRGRRIKPVTAPSGNVYKMPGQNTVFEAASQEDYEWLLSLRMRGG